MEKRVIITSTGTATQPLRCSPATSSSGREGDVSTEEANRETFCSWIDCSTGNCGALMAMLVLMILMDPARP